MTGCGFYPKGHSPLVGSAFQALPTRGAAGRAECFEQEENPRR